MGFQAKNSKLVLFVEVILAGLLFIFSTMLPYKAMLYFNLIQKDQPFTTSLLLFLTGISLVYVCALLYFSQRLRGQSLKVYGLSRDRFPGLRTIGILIIAAAILQVAIEIVVDPIAIRLFHQAPQMPEVKSLSALFIGIVLSFVGAGLREELFFRAYLISKIKLFFTHPKLGITVAAIIQIIFFGYVHKYQGPVGMVETGVSAIAFTIAFLWSGSLWNAILLHTFYDILGFSLIFFWPNFPALS